MAKKKDESAEEAETNKSLGAAMKSKLTQRERNLLVKQELIDKGERDEPSQLPAQTQKERNLQLKKELRAAEDIINKEAEKIEHDEQKRKSKGT